MGIGWPGAIGFTRNGSVPWEVMPEISTCSVREMRRHLNNPQTREGIIRREIRRIPQEMLKRVVDNFNVRVAAVLSYSSAVDGTNVVLITEKV